MRARLFKENGRPVEGGDILVEDDVYVLIDGHPGLGPLTVYVYDGPVFIQNPPSSYARYREAKATFIVDKVKQ